MARKRMFDMEIVDTDLFLDMPQSSQNLYFHLGMRADDDGFVSNPKKIIKIIGANEDDLKLLFLKKFVIPFESGVCVITHWKLNNYLRKDRYTETIYKAEKRQLTEDENGVYSLGIPKVNQLATSGIHSIEENSIDKNSIEENRDKPKKESKKKYGEYKNVLLTDKELQSLKSDYGNYNDLITYLDEYIEMKGYKAKSHYLCIKKWVVDAVQKKGASTNNSKGKYSDEELDRLLNGPAPTQKYDIDEMIAKGEIIWLKLLRTY